MLENSLKTLLGRTFIISHFLLILSVISLRFAGKFNHSATKAALAILVPLLLTYGTALIVDLLNRRHKTTGRTTVTANFTFQVLFAPSLFILFIAAIIVKQAIMPDSVENFTVYLSLGESVFGIYLGAIFRLLFTPPSEMAASSRV